MAPVGWLGEIHPLVADQALTWLARKGTNIWLIPKALAVPDPAEPTSVGAATTAQREPKRWCQVSVNSRASSDFAL